MKLHDVTGIYDDYFERHSVFSTRGLPVVAYAPVAMTPADRMFLWALTYATCPSTYLEIGSLQGGSALIVASALDILGSPGKLALIDPEPRIPAEIWTRLESRSSLIRGFSPGVVAEAVATLRAPVELALIDGDHSTQGARADAEGVLPFLAPGSHLLFHDAHFHDVARAVDEFVAAHPREVVDCGIVTREAMHDPQDPEKRPVWGGLRMLRRK